MSDKDISVVSDAGIAELATDPAVWTDTDAFALTSGLLIGAAMLLLFGIVVERVRAWRSRATRLERANRELSELPTADKRAFRAALRTAVEDTDWLLKPFHEWWAQTWVQDDELCNAIQAGEFLHDEALEPRRYAWGDALPGLLTALGIFGTFIGIVAGLSGLNLDSGGSLPPQLSDLISGLKTAFGTSIAGLFLSIASTGLLRSAEAAFEDARLELVRRLDGFVDRAIPQKLLGEVRDSIVSMHRAQARQTAGVLEALRSIEHLATERNAALVRHEAIHTQALDELRSLEDDIGDALERTIQASGLVEAVNGMADRIATTQTDGVGEIVDRFTKQMGEKFADRFEKLGTSMDSMVGANDAYQQQMGAVVSALADSLEGQRAAAAANQAVLEQTSVVVGTLTVASERIGSAAAEVRVATTSSTGFLEQQNVAAASVAKSLEAQTLAAAGLTEAVQALQSWHQQVRAVLDDQLDEWGNALTTQKELTGTIAAERARTDQLIAALSKTAGSFEQIATHLDETTGEIRTELKTVGAARYGSLERLDDAAKSLEELRKGIDASLVTFSETAELLAANSSGVRTSLDSLTLAADGQKELATHGAALAVAMKDSVDSQRELANSFAYAATAAGSLAPVATGLQNAAKSLSATSDGLQAAQAAITKAADQLRMRDDEAQQTWETVTTGLRQTSGDLNQGMKAYSSQVNDSVSRTVQELDTHLAKATDDFGGAVAALHAVIEELDEVVRTLADAK